MKSEPPNTTAVEKIVRKPLQRLRLDPENPRFGSGEGTPTTQQEVLNTIVDKFGIDDVLSSIAVNGYFDSEPLVGVETANGEIKIVEGNRRLAACLILTSDARAKDQEKRGRAFRKIMAERDVTLDEVPVLVYDEDKDQSKLLPYLGVRHIAGAQPWDSYAKATWVARVLEDKRIDLAEISRMVGDAHRTVARIVEGYYFVNQLREAGLFNPSNSTKSGRGSNPEFPFSWVYTTLGYAPIREWLDLSDLREGPKKNPTPQERLDRAEQLMVFLFGNSSEDKESAVPDSRDIPRLAKAVADPARLRLIRAGKNVKQAEEQTKPSEERIEQGLLRAVEALETVFGVLGQESEIQSEAVQGYAKRLERLIANILKQLQTTPNPRSD